MITINEVLDAFLEEVGEGDRRSAHSPGSIIDLVRRFLNDYGYEGLGEFDQARFDKEYDEGRHYCEIFGPDKLEPHHLNQFLGVFVPRKIAARKSFYKACGPLVEKLSAWLVEAGHWTAEQQHWFRALVGPKAGSDLAAGDAFSKALHKHIHHQRAPVPDDLNEIDEEDYLEEECTITKVGSTSILFENYDEGEIVVKLPKAVTKHAQVGWQVLLELARVGDQWYILNAGSVDPQ